MISLRDDGLTNLCFGGQQQFDATKEITTMEVNFDVYLLKKVRSIKGNESNCGSVPEGERCQAHTGILDIAMANGRRGKRTLGIFIFKMGSRNIDMQEKESSCDLSVNGVPTDSLDLGSTTNDTLP